MRRRARFYWRKFLRRVAWFVLLPVAILFLLRVVWGVESSRRLAGVRREMAASGMRFSVEDFPDGAAMSREENGYLDVADALDLFKPTNAEREALYFADASHVGTDIEQQPTASEAAVIRGYLVGCQPIMELLDRAGRAPKMALPPALLKKEWVEVDFMTLGAYRGLLFLPYHLAWVAHDRRDDVEAMRSLERMLTIARAADAHPRVVGQMVAVACRSFTAQAVEKWSLELSLKTPEEQAAARRLIAELLDNVQLRGHWREAWIAEMVAADFYARAERPGLDAWWCRPWYEDDLARFWTQQLREAPVAEAENWPQAVALGAPQLRTPNTMLEAAARQQELELHFGAQRPALLHLRAVADASAAAELLAAMLYRQAHGVWPASAEALVPEFLPALPQDRFTGGKPFRYRMDADGPTVWSVGENGVDDGGVIAYDTDGYKLRRYGAGSGSQKDIVYGAAWWGRSLVPRVAPPPPDLPPP